MIEAVSIICLIIMAAIFLTIVMKIVLTDKSQRLKYIKSFKKGKFAVIYIVSFPLFLMANLYAGTEIFKSIFSSINLSAMLIVLKYDFSSIAKLYADSPIFKTSIIVEYGMCFLNAALFTFAIFGQSIITYFQKKTLHKKSPRVMIAVGNNDINFEILRSFDGQRVIIGKFDSEEKDRMFSNNILAISTGKINMQEFLEKNLKNIEKREIIILINAENDAQNLIYGVQIKDFLKKSGIRTGLRRMKYGIHCYTFGSSKSESEFLKLETSSFGAIRFINRYKLLARKFAEAYPITKYMTEKQINYENGTVRNNVKINVVLIGFGQTNQEILNTLVPNNCLITDSDGKVKNKVVNYHIFDNKTVITNKNYNFDFRYSREKDTYNPKDYFPLPDTNSNISFENIDINDYNFFTKLNQLNGKDNFNYYIISLGDEMLNLDIAEKLAVLTKNFEDSHIFVKINSTKLAESVKNNVEENRVHLFGNAVKDFYSSHHILQESIEKMAIERHFMYVDEVNPNEDREVLANRLWFEKFNQVQRESNIFCCLNLRTKLNMFGFDYVQENSDMKDATEEFYKKYFKGTKLVRKEGKIDYRETYSPEGSNRYNYAFQEHSRWNMYMFSNGFTPAKKSEFNKFSKKELMEKMQHLNLTTFDGLVDYANIVMKRDGVDFFTADVIKYDYQILDDAEEVLSNCGYKIVKKDNVN